MTSYQRCKSEICEHAFLAAIFEDIYDEEVEEQRYLGSGVILNPKWIMTSCDVIRDTQNEHAKNAKGVFVRVGSDYWSKGGSVHEIKEIRYLGNKDTASLSLISVTPHCTFSDIVQPVIFNRKRVISKEKSLTYYGWQSNDELPLGMRRKYVRSSRTDVAIMDDRECREFNNASKNRLCCSERIIPMFCTHNRGAPLLNGEYLFGIHLAKSCDKYNSTVHIFENVVSYYNWLRYVVGSIDIRD